MSLLITCVIGPSAPLAGLWTTANWGEWLIMLRIWAPTQRDLGTFLERVQEYPPVVF